MKSFIFSLPVLALLLLGAQLSLQQQICPTPPNEVDTNRLVSDPLEVTSTCGEVLTGTHGNIVYKLFEDVGPNERCVWRLIAPPTQGGLNGVAHFQIQVQKFQGSNTEVILSTFNKNMGPVHQIPLDSTPVNITSAHMVLVTFATGPNIAPGEKGFALEYTATPLGTNQISARSKHITANADTFFVKHPEGDGSYSDDELTTILFNPLNNVYNPEREASLVVVKGQLESCLDHLKFYKFSSNCTGANRWQLEGFVCQDSPDRIYTHSADPMLIVFESDSSTTNTGFELMYSA